MLKNLFLSYRVYFVLGLVALLFAFSYRFNWLIIVAWVTLGLFILAFITDLLLLFQSNIKFDATRLLPKIFSLSDLNKVIIVIENLSPRAFSFQLIDELPFQLQKRDFTISGTIDANKKKQVQYELLPTERGEYEFGNILIYIQTFLGFAERRIIIQAEQMIPTYPSVLQMKQYALYASEKIAVQQGIKKMRRIGYSYEFEQIKDYVNGDDYRHVNWKASSRNAKLMVNQYEMEKSQQIYCVIDKSRNMKMPFHGLTLMDYAINTTLALSNIALQKQDKAGLITFSDKVGAALKADNGTRQLHKILETLYREEERPVEANYELLHQIAQKVIKGRSLFLLFMNFENPQSLERVLPILRRINHTHLLLVVFFENTEIQAFANEEATTLEGVYQHTIAQQFLYDKQQMAILLRQYGIQTVLSKPEDLSINTINKYLELKSRGLL
jgi:uncharacterized protein (DUF58 family)